MKKGWQTKKLGDVCSLLNRGISPAYLEKGGVCVLNQKCIRDHEVSYEPSRRHDSNTKKVAEERFIQLGDVLVNSTGTGTLGRVAQVREEPEETTTVDSHVAIVRPIPGLFHLDFFGYMLVVIEDAIKEAGEGCGGQTELSRSVLAERFSVSYPASLAEQQRIVGLLDEAFEGLATAKANAEKNLQNARALFESHLQSVFSQRGEGWVEKRLEECFRLKSGDGLTSKAMNDGRFPVFGGNGIAGMHDEFNLSGDNVIIGRVGALCGNARHITEEIWLTDNAFRIVDRHFEFDDAFLTYLLNFKNLRSFARQAAQPVISNSSLKDLLLTFPGIVKQKKIAAQLDALAEETHRLESIYQQKLAALEALKKSLLHQAFTGAL
jgi:type I restriction enzyme S subunit